jgi:hypothetical protein
MAIVPPLTDTRGNPTDPPVKTKPQLLNVNVPPVEEIKVFAEPIDVPNEREMSVNVSKASFKTAAPDPVKLPKERVLFVPV